MEKLAFLNLYVPLNLHGSLLWGDFGQPHELMESKLVISENILQMYYSWGITRFQGVLEGLI